MDQTTFSVRVRQIARFDVLDFYRYAGALWVAVTHFTIYYLPLDGSIKARVNLLQPLMGFFFTLSGFVIMHIYDRRISTMPDYVDYLQKRLARIYPLHLLTLVLAIVWGSFIGSTARYSSEAILPNILLVHAWNTTKTLYLNYPSWSVSAEFFVYLLFPVFLIAVNRLGLRWALLLPVVSAVAITVFFEALGMPHPWTYATYDFGCLRAVPSFLGGMAIYRLATVRFAKLVVPGWVAHGLTISTVPMMLLGVPGTLVLALFVLVVFLLARAEPKEPGVFSTPFFRGLANCSYGFYMLHALIGAAMLSVLPRVLHLDEEWKFGLAAAAMVVTTVVAVLSFRFFEDPARQYLGTWGRHRH
jgi:peptidoglycan/LPS O-acetylase OafA/YrhL